MRLWLERLRLGWNELGRVVSPAFLLSKCPTIQFVKLRLSFSVICPVKFFLLFSRNAEINAILNTADLVINKIIVSDHIANLGIEFDQFHIISPPLAVQSRSV